MYMQAYEHMFRELCYVHQFVYIASNAFCGA